MNGLHNLITHGVQSYATYSGILSGHTQGNTGEIRMSVSDESGIENAILELWQSCRDREAITPFAVRIVSKIEKKTFRVRNERQCLVLEKFLLELWEFRHQQKEFSGPTRQAVTIAQSRKRLSS